MRYYCPFCGADFYGNAGNFCPECGHKGKVPIDTGLTFSQMMQMYKEGKSVPYSSPKVAEMTIIFGDERKRVWFDGRSNMHFQWRRMKEEYEKKLFQYKIVGDKLVLYSSYSSEKEHPQFDVTIPIVSPIKKIIYYAKCTFGCWGTRNGVEYRGLRWEVVREGDFTLENLTAQEMKIFLSGF